MKEYEVCYISGHTLKYSVARVEANDEADAVGKVFDLEGAAFENRLVSVREVNV